MEVNYRQNFQKMDGEMKKSAQKKRGWFREGPALTSPSSAFMRNIFH
jgi:hypothetical protein